MELEIKTLTPLWTGGVEAGKVDRIHETGLLGSLRWWYEAIVRGLGGEACDPSTGKCRFDAEAYEKSQADNERQRLRDAGLCDVCQVFGATGWRRRFRLEIGKDTTKQAWTPPPDMLNVRPPDRTRGWYLPPGRVGQVTMRFMGDDQALALVAALFRFLERWGAIGAKPQLGYGVFAVDERAKVQQWANKWQWKVMGSQPLGGDTPDLRRFGFFSYRFTAAKGWWTRVPGLERLLGRNDTARALQQLVENGMLPVAPALKNKWRFEHWQGPPRVERFLFGTTMGPRIRSKLGVSWAYSTGNSWEVRGWVWLPEQDNQNHSIDSRLLQQIWQGVRDIDIWQTTLKVADGALTCIPDAVWQPWTVQDVREFLEDSQ